MGKKNQDVHLRIFMDANQAEKAMEVVTKRMGELMDIVKSMKKALRDNGLNMNASADQLRSAGLGEDFTKRLKNYISELDFLKKVTKQVSTTVEDLNQMVANAATKTRAELETMLKQIEHRFKTFAPVDEKSKASMLELQHLYEQVRVEIERRNVKQMTGADAAKAYARAEELMKQGAMADANALREVSVALGKAKDARGISIQQAQLYAAAEAEVNKVLAARGTAFVSAERGAKALSDAQNLVSLSRKGKADTSIEEANHVNALKKVEEAEKAVVEAEKKHDAQIKLIDEDYTKLAQRREKNANAIKEAEKAVATAQAAVPAEMMETYHTSQQVLKVVQKLEEEENNLGKQVKETSRLRQEALGRAAALNADIRKYEQGIANEKAKANPNNELIERARTEIAELITRRNIENNLVETLAKNEATLNAQYQEAAAKTKTQRDVLDSLNQKMAAYKTQIEAVVKSEAELNALKGSSSRIKRDETRLNNRRTAADQELQLAKDQVEQEKQMAEQMKNILEQAKKYGGVDIATLKQMYEELSFIRDHTKDNAAVNDMGLALKDLKARMDELATARRPLAELQKELGNARMLVSQARSNPASVSAEEYQRVLRIMQDAQNTQQLDIKTQREAAAVAREMNEILKAQNVAVISKAETIRAERQAQEVLTAGEKAQASVVRETIDLYRQMVNQDGITIEKKRELGATLKQLEDLYKGTASAAKVMSEADAKAAADMAQSVLTKIRNNGAGSVNMSEVQTALAMTAEAQKANASVEVVQRNAAVNRELTEIMKGKNQVMLEASTIDKAMADAEQILADKEQANVGKVRETIDLYRQMVNQDGITIEKKRELAATLKQMEDLYNDSAKSVKALMDATAAQNAVTSGRDLINQAMRSPSAVKAEDLRKVVETAKEAQKATGISVRLQQEANAVEQQATAILQGKNIVLVDVATRMQAEESARNLLIQQEKAHADELQRTIGIYQQMVNEEGLEIGELERRKKVLQELQQLQKGQYKLKASDVQNKYDSLLDSDKNVRKDAMTSEINETIEALKRLKNQQGVTREETVKYDTMIKKLEASLRGEGKAARDAAEEQKLIDNTLKNIKSAPLQDLEKTAKLLQERMKALQRNTKDYVTASAQYKEVRRQLQGVNGEMKRQSDWFTTNIKKLANYLGIFGGFYLVRQQMQNMFQANIKYDDTLTNIRKTTQMTAESVKTLAENIKLIDTRTSLDDINNMAYAAGRLGVKGVSDVMGFTRAANYLGVALGEQLGEGTEAVEQLMKVSELMGATKEFGLEESLIKTGSAINELTMNTVASAEPIVNFLRRIAGVGTQAGMSEADLIGLGGAVNALGQNVEMSATSISKMLVQISSNSKVVARALRMTAEEEQKFINDIGSGYMTDALMTVLQKTQESGGLSHLGTIVKDLGSEGQRVIQTIATLSANYGKVRDMIQMSNKAFEEGTSVVNEYNLKNQNTAALWERLKNKISKAFVSSNAVSYIKEILWNLQELPAALYSVVTAFKPLMIIFDGFIFVLTKATWAVEALIYTLAIRSVTNWIVAIKAGENALGRLVVRFKEARAANMSFNQSLKATGALSKSNIFLLIAGVIATVVTYLHDAHRAAMKFKEDMEQALARTKAQTQETDAAISGMLTKLNEVWDSESERKSVIKQLNDSYGDYLDNLFTERDTYEEIVRAMEAANAQMKQKAILDAKTESEKNVRVEYGEKLGVAREKLINSLMSLMVTPDAATAARMADNLFKQRDKILVQEFDRNGQLSGYNAKTYNIQKERNQALAAATATVNINGQEVPVMMKDRVKNANGEDYFMLSGFTDDIFSALEKMSDLDLEQQRNLKSIENHFNRDAYLEATKALEQNQVAMDEAWKSVEDFVTFGGNRVAEFDADAKKWQGYYSRQDAYDLNAKKQNMGDAERNDWIAKLDAYIKPAALAYQNLLSVDQYEGTDKARELDVFLSNARKAREILLLGRTEQKPDKSAAQSENQANKDAYKSIISLIESFYKRQEEAYKKQLLKGDLTQKQYEQRLRTNDSARHETLAAADERIIGRITSEAYTKAVNDMASRNIAGEFGEQILRDIYAVGDVRSIGERFETSRTRFIVTNAKSDIQRTTEEVAKAAGEGAEEITSEAATQAVAVDKTVRNKADLIKQAMDYFMEQLGLSVEQAAGIIGVLYEESKLDPHNYNRAEKSNTMEGSAANGAGYGAGLAQWSNARKPYILDHLREQTGKALEKIEDYGFEEQLEAIVWEMQTKYNLNLEMLRQQPDSTAAADIMFRGFENGGNGRLASKEFMDKYTWAGGYQGGMFGYKSQMGRAVAASKAQALYEGKDEGLVFINADTTKYLTEEQQQIVQEYNSFFTQLQLSADKHRTAIQENQVKTAKEIAEAWLAQNPIGKISQQYQEELETLGFMLNDFSEESRKAFEVEWVTEEDGTQRLVQKVRTIEQLQSDVMEAYLTIGRMTSHFDLAEVDENGMNVGVEKFRDYIMLFPDLAYQAQAASDEAIRGIYYKTFEYAEQYDQALKKQADKMVSYWGKVFDASDINMQAQALTRALDLVQSKLTKLEKYGLSDRTKLDETVDIKAVGWWREKQKLDELTRKANADMLNAQSLEANDETSAKYKKAKIDEAQAELDALKKQADIVEEAYNGVVEAQLAVLDANREWIGEVEKSLEKFMEGIIPFQTWYYKLGEKESFANRLFGTKEERQKAFGDFMDELKKTTINATKEYVRMRMSRIINKKLEEKGILTEEIKAQRQQITLQETLTAIKEALAQKQIATDTAKVKTEEALSTEETTTSLANAGTRAVGETAVNESVAVSRSFADLGPIAGAAAVGVITAIIGSFLTFAMNALGHKQKNKQSATKAKLVSGMLTYDRGNVQSIPAYDNGIIDYDMDDDGTYVPRYLNKNKIPVMADDGRVYMVDRNAMMPSSGTGMVTRPTLTTIGGVPSLVGERGPEMVIGRETTAAMQMYRPDLLRQIQLFDRNRSNGFAKAYDSGNVQQMPMADGAGEDLRALLAANQEMMAQLAAAQAALVDRLNRPINATINKNGAGGLVETVAEGFVEARQRGNIKNVSRLFGR